MQHNAITQKQLGKRILGRSGSSATTSATVKEISPNGKFALLAGDDGQSTWVEAETYQLLDVLPDALPSRHRAIEL